MIKSDHIDFAGYSANDFLAGILVELVKLNLRQGGVRHDLVDDDQAGAKDLLEVASLSADAARDSRPLEERVRAKKVVTDLKAEKAKR